VTLPLFSSVPTTRKKGAIRHILSIVEVIMKTAYAALLGLAATASAIELTPDNWDSATAGKTVFIKFLAPW